jgi:DNA-binding transcriptional LysR family regulator
MFSRLFAESGLSLDRLRALVEVGAAGSIVQAAGGDPVRQSQYSRQIKELEDFFRTALIERTAKGIRFTARGKELARISRFALLGLSNFQRGCLGEERTYRIGAGATFIQTFLLPLLANRESIESAIPYAVETLPDDIMERRLHELTLDFGFVTNSALSRPLQSKNLVSWNLELRVARLSEPNEKRVLRAFYEGRVPFALATEVPPTAFALLSAYRPSLICNNFVEARNALLEQGLACFLPDYLGLGNRENEFHSLAIASGRSGRKSSTVAEDQRPGSVHRFVYSLAWNPRLLRLNAQAVARRDFLMSCRRD